MKARGSPTGYWQRVAAVLLGWIALASAVHAASAATLLQRPYLQNLQEDRVSILWTAREKLPALLQYSTDQSFSNSVTASVRLLPPLVTAPDTVYLYQADLTGLTPGFAYSYRVLLDGQNLTPDAGYSFRAAGPGAFSFLVLGDSGTGTADQLAVALRMATEQPDMVLHVGDVGQYVGAYQEYTSYYFEFYWTLMRRVPFFSAPGNHDYMTADAQPYLSIQAQPTSGVPSQDSQRYYSFDRGDVHFIALDSNLLDVPAAADRMLTWLAGDLASTRAAWKVAFFHHLPYPIEHHVGDPICDAARERFVPLFDHYGVQLVINGHEHTYQRTKPMRAGVPVDSGLATIYVVSGGGGGTLHPVVPKDFLAHAESVYHYLRVEADASHITIHAIGTDGKEFDRYTLTRPVLRSDSPVVSVATGAPHAAPGELVSLYGTGLGTASLTGSGPAYPLALSGSSITVGGKPAPILFVSDTQINTQLPYGLAGSVTLQVGTAAGTAESSLSLADTAPALFPSGVWHASGSPVSATSPARPGETLVIYLTGLGEVDHGAPTGQAAPMSPLANVVAPVVVQIGNRSLRPFFAGLTPGLIGVYQVNVTLPADLQSQTCSLVVSADGNSSNAFNLPVQR